MLESESDLEVIGEAGDGLAAVELALREAPDVLVLDIRMPGLNGVEVTQKLRASKSPVKVLALTAYDDKRYVQEMLKAGAVGYVTKGAAAAEPAPAIRAVARGEKHLSPVMVEQLLNRIGPAAAPSPPGAHCLGAREREVLRLLADGHRSSAIAKRLNIATLTVEVHRRNMALKLGLNNVAELTKYAVREGLTSL